MSIRRRWVLQQRLWMWGVCCVHSFLFCPSCLMRRILRPSPGVRNANCGVKGRVGVGKHQSNSKPCTCPALQPLPKSLVKMWMECTASWKGARGDICCTHLANIHFCRWPLWLVLVFKITAGVFAECQDLTVWGQS